MYSSFILSIVFSPTATLNIEVEDIPDELLDDDDDQSNHASNMFLRQCSPSVKQWMKRVLVNPQEWLLTHPFDQKGPSNSFRDYLNTFDPKYKVWCIENDNEANVRLNLFVRNGKSIIMSGRSDYLITPAFTSAGIKVSKVNRLSHILCVIEIQSNSDADACEHQMLAYMYLLMNAKGMQSLIGFLVYADGGVRAYRATRIVTPTLGGVSGYLYEENDRFHVSNISLVFAQLIE